MFPFKNVKIFSSVHSANKRTEKVIPYVKNISMRKESSSIRSPKNIANLTDSKVVCKTQKNSFSNKISKIFDKLRRSKSYTKYEFKQKNIWKKNVFLITFFIIKFVRNLKKYSMKIK